MKKLRLKHVKINPSDLCNLTCQFCPRGNPDIYPNNNEHMTMKTFRKVLEYLKVVEGPFYFELVGHGEPTVARNFPKMARELHKAKKRYPNMITRVVSNGARFKRYAYEMTLFDEVIYDVYTDDEDHYWEEVAKWRHLNIMNINMINFAGKMRFAWNKERGDVEPERMLLNNRSGIFEIPLVRAINPPNHGDCVRPTEDITVNYNGDYLVCCEDWDNVKMGNVHEQDFIEFYYSEKFTHYRNQLAKGIREGQCKDCSYPGNNWHYGTNPTIPKPHPDWVENIEKRWSDIQALPDFPVDIES